MKSPRMNDNNSDDVGVFFFLPSGGPMQMEAARCANPGREVWRGYDMGLDCGRFGGVGPAGLQQLHLRQIEIPPHRPGRRFGAANQGALRHDSLYIQIAGHPVSRVAAISRNLVQRRTRRRRTKGSRIGSAQDSHLPETLPNDQGKHLEME